MPAGGRLARAPALGVRLVHLLEDPPDVVLQLPAGVVRLEAAVVADPPYVVADPVRLLVRPVEPLTGDLLAELDRLEHGRVAEAPTADVVDLRDAGSAKE